ncbi:MAG: hypothetical protein HQK65_15450 [Desulfamplus sp.]|nr:hypothetical protein [Desulfamplus sp.]
MDIEEKKALFAKYMAKLKENFEYTKDFYPPDVQEAHRIVHQLGDILVDDSIPNDISVQEALFDKIPREKMQWAMETIEKWKPPEEVEAEARARERERRQMNQGMEKRKLTEKKQQEMFEGFETMRILHAVDALDAVRPLISDECIAGGFPKPPELRDKLLKLHTLAHEIINGEFRYETDEGLFDLAWEIEDELYDAIENLKQIRKVVSDLAALAPSEDDDWDEEDED